MKNAYPQSIYEAALLLDKEHPGWEKKINITILKMHDAQYCILGQIYKSTSNNLDGPYAYGLDKLFGLATSDRLVQDCIFGRNANIQGWKDQINSRLNKVVEDHDFVWALAQMKEGKKVTLWDDLVYWYMKDGKIYNDAEVERNIFDIGHFPNTQKKGWRIVHQPKLSDLKVGDKFTVNSDIPTRPVYQKVVGGYIRIKRENQNCLEIWDNYKSFENARITIIS